MPNKEKSKAYYMFAYIFFFFRLHVAPTHSSISNISNNYYLRDVGVVAVVVVAAMPTNKNIYNIQLMLLCAR